MSGIVSPAPVHGGDHRIHGRKSVGAMRYFRIHGRLKRSRPEERCETALKVYFTDAGFRGPQTEARAWPASVGMVVGRLSVETRVGAGPVASRRVVSATITSSLWNS